MGASQVQVQVSGHARSSLTPTTTNRRTRVHYKLLILPFLSLFTSIFSIETTSCATHTLRRSTESHARTMSASAPSSPRAAAPLPTPKLLVVSEWADALPSVDGLKVACIGAGYVGAWLAAGCAQR